MLAKVHSGVVCGVDAYPPSLEIASVFAKASPDKSGDKCR